MTEHLKQNKGKQFLKRERKRGTLLSIVLLYGMVSGILFTIFVLFQGQSFYIKHYSLMPSWSFSLFSIIGILNFIWSLALWKWKKWGFYGEAAMRIIYSLIALFFHGSVGTIISNIVFLVIFIILLYPLWQFFE